MNLCGPCCVLGRPLARFFPHPYFQFDSTTTVLHAQNVQVTYGVEMNKFGMPQATFQRHFSTSATLAASGGS